MDFHSRNILVLMIRGWQCGSDKHCTVVINTIIVVVLVVVVFSANFLT